MGLDLYLYRENFVGLKDVEIKLNGEVFSHKNCRVVSIIEEVDYWRDTYGLYDWVENNAEITWNKKLLTHEVMQHLLDDCNEVLKNPEKAKELFPSDYPYEEYDYIEGLAELMKELLSSENPKEEYYFD